MASAGGNPETAACLPVPTRTMSADDHVDSSPSPAPRRSLFPIPTPPPGPTAGIKAPYKGFYKDLASISNYVGSITVSWGKAIDQYRKASFDLARLNFFQPTVDKQFVDNLFDDKMTLARLQNNLRLEKGIQADLGKNAFINTAWEGKFIMTVMSVTSLLSISFTIVDMIQSATTKDPTQAKLDFIVETVNQINGTVTETLERVKDVQVSPSWV